MTDVQGKIRFVLRAILGLLFFAAGVAKLLGAPMLVEEFSLFAPYGIGQWFRYLVGAIEIVGALLLIPRSRVPWGAAVLLFVCIGAFFAQLLVIHHDFIHPIVMGALLAWVGMGHRSASRDRPAIA